MASAKPSVLLRLGKSLLRIAAVLILILAPSSCLLMQPTGSSKPATLHADPEILKEDVRTLAESFGPRYHDKPENLARCREYIARRLSEHGAEVEEQAYRVRGTEFKNVRAFFGPKDAPRIVVGAHYDACYEGDNNLNTGADDNASGVAGLLELARLLKQQAPANASVELVAYCTEEPPFFGSTDMGSYRHAELLKQENANVKGVLVLEMIGYFSDEPDSQGYPFPLLKLLYPSKGNYVALVGGGGDRKLMATSKKAMKGSAPLPVYSSCIPRNFDSVHLSDHRNYWPFGYPAIMVTDTSFYRNPNYHLATDTWQSLDYRRMAHVVTQTHQAVLKLGE
jgi:hypothetical protein